MTEELGGVPAAPGGYEPVVVDWLAGGESPTERGVAVTILDLARQGVLALAWRDGELIILRVRASHHDFEARILDLLFNRVVRDREEVNASRVSEWLEEHAEQAASWTRSWEDAVTQQTLASLRGTARGMRLPRRNPRRERDQLLERWQAWADELAAGARARQRHPDQLAQWARTLLWAVPLGRAANIAERIQGDLSPSERDALVGEWCPVPAGLALAEALGQTLDALPRTPRQD